MSNGEVQTPISELPNELTKAIDVAGPHGIVRLLRGTDAQIFAGYRHYPSLYDLAGAIDKTARIAADLMANSDHSAIVMSGSGTSGRVAFWVAVSLNRVLKAAGKAPCCHYLISGGDAAILLSDELPEDDTDRAVRELKDISVGKEKVLVIGITCGLSAPYAAAMIDYAMDMDDKTNVSAEEKASTIEYSAAVLGFNTVELARPMPIEMWTGRSPDRSRRYW